MHQSCSLLRPLLPPPPLLYSNSSLRSSLRIDKATGGLLLCARTKMASSEFPKLFLDKSLIQKRYRAIVLGLIAGQSGTVEEPIDGKPSTSKFEVVRRTNASPYGPVTTVDLWPVTGRMHQLRKHMLHIGHPILGDVKYAPPLPPSAPSTEMCLWALSVDFWHPFTNQVRSVVSQMTAYRISATIQLLTRLAPFQRVHVSIDEPEFYKSIGNLDSHDSDSNKKRKV